MRKHEHQWSLGQSLFIGGIGIAAFVIIVSLVVAVPPVGMALILWAFLSWGKA